MWNLYILLCDEKTYYVGITNNLKNRIAEHQRGLSTFTKKFSTIKLVFTETHKTKQQAALREKQIKGWSRIKKEKLIKGKL